MTPLNAVQRRSIQRRLSFMEQELGDLRKFKELSHATYLKNRDTRRNVERLAENLVNASLDIAKIIASGESLQLPETYREVFEVLEKAGWIDDQLSSALQRFTRLRNILAHEYLDIRWREISRLIQDGPSIFGRFASFARSHITAAEEAQSGSTDPIESPDGS